MITMKRIGRTHALLLDISTDKSHMFACDDFEQKNPILTFDSNLTCRDSDGNIVCHLSSRDNYWTSLNSLGIVTDPVSLDSVDGLYDVEAQFCEKWLTVKSN